MNQKRMNLGSLLSLIAFLITILPATYNLVDSLRVFLIVLQEAQKKLVLLQEEQSQLLRQVYQSPQQGDNFSETMIVNRLIDLTEKVNRMEERQISFYENCKKTETTEDATDGLENAGDEGQEGDLWKMEPPPASNEEKPLDCPDGTCQVVEPPKQQQNQVYRRQVFRLF